MLIILDRDGVINQDSEEYIKSPAEWLAIPESLQAIAALNQAGHRVTVATNQSGLARGLYDQQTLEAIHQKMRAELAAVGGHLDAIVFCPHHPDDHCYCRKPKPGLYKEIGGMFDADLTNALVIGDSLRDLQAAQAVGSRAILVRSGKGQRYVDKIEPQIPVYTDLAQAVAALLIKQVN